MEAKTGTSDLAWQFFPGKYCVGRHSVTTIVRLVVYISTKVVSFVGFSLFVGLFLIEAFCTTVNNCNINLILISILFI